MENLEISKQTKDYSLSLGVIDAIQHPLKIINSTDQDLSQAIAFCIACLGLPDESIPKGLKRSFLLEFIRAQFKFYSVEEIKTAFTMLVKGDYMDKTPKHYNNFSPEYFGSVMAVYKSHREKASTEIFNRSNRNKIEKPYAPDNVEKAKIQREFDEMVIKPIFDRYKEFGKLDSGTTPAKFIYNSLIGHHKIMEFNNVEKQSMKDLATRTMKDRHERLKTAKAETYKEHKDKIRMIGELYEPEIMNDQIINECHLMCIKKCFDRMIETNFRF